MSKSLEERALEVAAWLDHMIRNNETVVDLLDVEQMRDKLDPPKPKRRYFVEPGGRAVIIADDPRQVPPDRWAVCELVPAGFVEKVREARAAISYKVEGVSSATLAIARALAMLEKMEAGE